MRSSRIYRAAREYLGLRKEDVCAILGWEMEDLEAIENGLQPSLDMQGQLYKLYRLGDKDYVDVNEYPIEGLNEHDKREVVKMFLFADEVRNR
jgi:hypothetical protein